MHTPLEAVLAAKSKSLETAVQTLEDQHRIMQEQVVKQEIFLDNMNEKIQVLFKRLGYNKK